MTEEDKREFEEIRKQFFSQTQGRRMTDPIASQPVDKNTPPPPEVQQQSGGLSLPEWLKIVLTVLAVLAAVPGALLAGGIAVPHLVVVIASTISAIAAAFGIASPGLSKLQAKK